MGYIAAADAGDLSHFPLPLGWLPVQAVAQDDYLLFLEERSIPKSRAGLRDYLDAIGVDAFDPLEIIKKTSGRMAEDQQWIQVEVSQ